MAFCRYNHQLRLTLRRILYIIPSSNSSGHNNIEEMIIIIEVVVMEVTMKPVFEKGMTPGYYSGIIINNNNNDDDDDDAVTVVVADRGAEVEAVEEVDVLVAVVDHRPNKGDVLIAALLGIVIRVVSIRESIIVVEMIVVRRGIAKEAEAVADVGLIDRVVSIVVVEEEEVVEAEAAVAAEEVTDLTRMALQIIIGMVGATSSLLDPTVMEAVVHDDPNRVPTSAIVVSIMILALAKETSAATPPTITSTKNVGILS